jgi:hypothetical protein
MCKKNADFWISGFSEIILRTSVCVQYYRWFFTLCSCDRGWAILETFTNFPFTKKVCHLLLTLYTIYTLSFHPFNVFIEVFLQEHKVGFKKKSIVFQLSLEHLFHLYISEITFIFEFICTSYPAPFCVPCLLFFHFFVCLFVAVLEIELRASKQKFTHLGHTQSLFSFVFQIGS